MNPLSSEPLSMIVGRALWNLVWPALFICGPLVGLVMLDVFFGLPGQLWFVGGGFFVFSLFLFGILLRGEIRRLRRDADRRASGRI